MQNWIRELFEDPDMVGMGHGQTPDDLNLGLGWIYYSLARAMRPSKIVVIGSYRGFVPLVFGKALCDNGNDGEVHFIDPSLVDPFWKDADAVQAHFARYGVCNVRHHLATTQEFVETRAHAALDRVGIVFVDGYHSAEQARFDHQAFLDKMPEDGIALFHDSVRERRTRIYGEENAYVHTVCHYMAELRRDPAFEVFTFPDADGLTMVKKAPSS
jgi:predicted O-methyltransferase YrrM